MRIILQLLVVTLVFNNLQESIAKYRYTPFKCKQFTMSTPVELNVSIFILFLVYTFG